jgi:hypothetical protein
MIAKKITDEMLSRPPTFENVAELITDSEDKRAWVATAFREWVWDSGRSVKSETIPVDGLFASIQKSRKSRRDLLKRFSNTLPKSIKAIEDIIDVLGDWSYKAYLMEDSLGEGFGLNEQRQLAWGLAELHRRALEVGKSLDLLSPDGKPKRGRGKPIAQGSIDEMLECACAITTAWRVTQEKLPGPQSRVVALDSLTAWPEYFKKAHPRNAKDAFKVNNLNTSLLDHFNKIRERASQSPG